MNSLAKPILFTGVASSSGFASTAENSRPITSELMNCLTRTQDQYESEEEFRAFALDEVRRFINDLRVLNIELSLRPGQATTSKRLSD